MNFLLFTLLNLFLLHLCIFQQANAMAPNEVQILKSVDCAPVNKKYPTKIESFYVKFSENNTFLVTGLVIIHEQLPVNIELDVSITRCNLDYTGCSKFESIKFPRICEKSYVKTSIAYQIMSSFYPTPKCPVQPGSYEIKTDLKFLLNYFLSLPTDGYLWKVTLIFYEKSRLKRVRPLACFNIDLIANSKKTKM